MVVKWDKVGNIRREKKGVDWHRIMFLGEYHHTLDDKHRLAIPSKLRREIGKEGVLTRGLDQSLFLYPKEAWKQLAQKLMELPMGKEKNRGFIRLMLAGAQVVSIDSAGRILVPEYLITYANLRKEVVVAGVLDRIEVWDKKRWTSYTEQLEKRSNDIAETLGEIGF